MQRVLRESALCASLAAGCSVVMGWLGLYSFAWNDYETEARPSFEALAHGHLVRFLQLAPAYGGSLVERAPFALLAGLGGGGSLTVYRMVAAPCLFALAALAVWMCARMRAEGRSLLARVVAVFICVANPVTLGALELGHPEELLGACLCVAAVVLASRNRPVWAGALLGLAIANKEWALLAAAPVLLALPCGVSQRAADGRRAHRQIFVCMASTCVATALVLAPLLLVSGGRFAASAKAVAAIGAAQFQPRQIWWFLGYHGPLVHGNYGASLPGYRIGPVWIATLSHPLIIVVGLAIAAGLWLARRRQRVAVSERDAMLALALALLLRCMLDTWDIGYYMLPFTIALLAWEIRGPSRPPLVTLVGAILPWFCLEELAGHGLGADGQSLLFTAWTVPLAIWLGVRLFTGEQRVLAPQPANGGGTRIQEPSVGVLGTLAPSA
jgi:Glycosyltransferase family 87